MDAVVTLLRAKCTAKAKTPQTKPETMAMSRAYCESHSPMTTWLMRLGWGWGGGLGLGHDDVDDEDDPYRAVVQLLELGARVP
jgi:hypothetical protein